MFINQSPVVKKHWHTSRAGKKYLRTTKTNFGLFRCDNCNTTFERQIGNEIAARRCNNAHSHYCASCPAQSLAAMKGQVTQQRQRQTKVGQRTITTHGYVAVYVGTTHNSRSVRSGSIFEHILVMEKQLGREIEKGKIVHHIDGNKQNNLLTNLDQMTVKEHNNCHGKTDQIIFALVKRGLVVFNRGTKLYEFGSSFSA